jgi:hypothetical protein
MIVIVEVFYLLSLVYSYVFYLFSSGYCEWNGFPDFILSKFIVGLQENCLLLDADFYILKIFQKKFA